MGGDSSGLAQEPPEKEAREAYLQRKGWGAFDPFFERAPRQAQVGVRRTARDLAPDISASIFSGDEARYRFLMDANPTYFSYSILTLITQSQEAFEAFARDVDLEQVMIEPGCLARLAAYFSGYVDNDSGLIEGERLPALDIKIAPTFKVAFKTLFGTARTSTFKLKVMGIGGTGAQVLSQSMETNFGPYGRSCQLQAPVAVQWRSYVRASTGDRLLTLKFLPTNIRGLYAALDDDPSYKPIEAPRDTGLAIVNRSGEKPTELTWRIARGCESHFEVPLTLTVGSLNSTHSVLIDSKVTAELAMTLTHEGDGGHLYACDPDALLLRLDT